jgi:hypothetical protein
MMSATKQLEDAVFYTALNMADLVQRKLFLDQNCAGNPGLRSVVEEMLLAQSEADHFFAKERASLFLAADELPADAPLGYCEEKVVLDEQIGTHIERYKLLQKIGEGGCGVVYMAEQEKPVRRRVALKVIKLGMDTVCPT